MSEMIERLAKAIYAHIPTWQIVREYDTTGSDRKVERRVDDTWEEAEDRHEECREFARVVLRAMREADFDVLDAGVCQPITAFREELGGFQITLLNAHVSGQDIGNLWRAMIDAALQNDAPISKETQAEATA